MSATELYEKLREIAKDQSELSKLTERLTISHEKLAKAVEALHGLSLQDAAFIEVILEDMRIRVQAEKQKDVDERAFKEKAAQREHELKLKAEERKTTRLKGVLKILIVLAGAFGTVAGGLFALLEKLNQ